MRPALFRLSQAPLFGFFRSWHVPWPDGPSAGSVERAGSYVISSVLVMTGRARAGKKSESEADGLKSLRKNLGGEGLTLSRAKKNMGCGGNYLNVFLMSSFHAVYAICPAQFIREGRDLWGFFFFFFFSFLLFLSFGLSVPSTHK